MAQILVFGASTTYGAWDPEGGWVGRLRKVIDKRVIATKQEFEWFVYNLGIDGDDTDGILERFEDETKRRLWEGEETVFIISAAINDALFNIKTRELRCPPARYQENIEKLIKLAGKYSDKIIFVGTLPVDESKVDPIPWLPDHSYKNEYVEEYNEITKSACRVEGVHFVEIYQNLIGRNYTELLADGVHGNAAGHKLIFETVKNYLVEHKIIDLTP